MPMMPVNLDKIVCVYNGKDHSNEKRHEHGLGDVPKTVASNISRHTTEKETTWRNPNQIRV
jgi:hypothetical protein